MNRPQTWKRSSARWAIARLVIASTTTWVMDVGSVKECTIQVQDEVGGRKDPVNEPGIQWYSNLIDGLLKRGITPFVVGSKISRPLDSAKLISP